MNSAAAPARQSGGLRLALMAGTLLLASSSAGVDALSAAPSPQVPQNRVRSIVEGSSAPDWLTLPTRAQMILPDGVKLEVLSTAIVSHDNRREAALVGVFRNAGRALRGVSLTLAFIGADGETIVWSAADLAGIREVGPDETLPFKFPLVPTAALAAPVSSLRVTLDESAPSRRPVQAKVVGYRARQARNDATVITGEIEIGTTPANPVSLRVAVLLLDSNQHNLDMLVGEATPVSGTRYRFELRGELPVGRRTRSVRLWAQTAE